MNVCHRSFFAFQANLVFVNIDTGAVELPEDLPEFPFKSQLVQDCSFWLRNQLPFDANDDVDGDNNRSAPTRDSGFRDSFVTRDDVIEVPKSESIMSLPSKMDILQQSEAMKRITALAKRTGVITSLDDISDTLDKVHMRDGAATEKRSASSAAAQSDVQQQQQQQLSEHERDLITNNVIREVFLHYFLQILQAFESFVIQPPTDVTKDMWEQERESMQTFDKAAFLGDQPEAHLPFLSAFIETQMFTTFIDSKILSAFPGEKDANLDVFAQRLQSYKDEHGDRRVKVYNRNTMANEGGEREINPVGLSCCS